MHPTTNCRIVLQRCSSEVVQSLSPPRPTFKTRKAGEAIDVIIIGGGCDGNGNNDKKNADQEVKVHGGVIIIGLRKAAQWLGEKGSQKTVGKKEGLDDYMHKKTKKHLNALKK